MREPPLQGTNFHAPSLYSIYRQRAGENSRLCEWAQPRTNFCCCCCCCLPASPHPVLLGRTSAQTAPGPVTGFGGHSSKGLPFSNRLWGEKHRCVCPGVLLQTDILHDRPILTMEFFLPDYYRRTCMGCVCFPCVSRKHTHTALFC